MAHDVEHHLICLLAICIIPVGEMSIQISANFYLVVSLLNFENSKSAYLDYKSFKKEFADISPQSLACLFFSN